MGPKPSLPPGPRGHWLLGSLREVIKTPFELYLEGLRQYGDIVYYRVATWRFYQLNHPDHFKHVLIDRPERYWMGKAIVERARPVLGNGILNSDGELWRRQRRLMQPGFHREHVRRFTTIAIEESDAMVSEWERAAGDAPLHVLDDVMRVGMRIAMRSLFGATAGRSVAEIGDTSTSAIREFNAFVWSIFRLPLSVPTPANRRMNGLIGKLNGTVDDIIAQRRAASDAPKTDLLGLLLSARDEDGSGMPDEQVKDEVRNLLIAGYETSATGMAWAFYLISQHPDVEARIVAELAEKIGDRLPTPEDIPQLSYLSRVVDEVLRLYAPVWLIMRQALEEDEISGYRIPKHAYIVLAPAVLHRHPAFWDHAERFDPDRFLPERGATRPRSCYAPFGAGRRLCLGKPLAVNELIVYLAVAYQRLQLRLASGYRMKHELLASVIRPSEGLPMIVSRRDERKTV